MTLTAILVLAIALIIAFVADAHRNHIREERRLEKFFGEQPKARKTRKQIQREKELDHLLGLDECEEAISN